MTQKLFCMKCDDVQDVEYKSLKVTHNIKGEEIVVKTMLPFCSICGSELANRNFEKSHFDVALNEYRKRKGLLLPEQIKQIREQYGLSQRGFARALGFAEPTINRYELGALQDSVHNSLIFLAKTPSNMILIAFQNKNNLTAKELNSIEKKVKELEQNTIEDTTNSLPKLNEKINMLEAELVKKIDKVDKKLDALVSQGYGEMGCFCHAQKEWDIIKNLQKKTTGVYPNKIPLPIFIDNKEVILIGKSEGH